MLRLVSATRLDEEGQSWLRQSSSALTVIFTYSNTRGLPDIYNEAIDAEGLVDDDVLVFVHDDVSLLDSDFEARVNAALEQFEVVGVAGNTRRMPGQVAWLVVDRKLDTAHLSGSVSHPLHTDSPFMATTCFGPSPQEVRLLDGLLLAVKVGSLRRGMVRFDPLFMFHHYDMDFCRQCELAGLRMGTWPITVAHASVGSLGTPAWRESLRVYHDKWGLS